MECKEKNVLLTGATGFLGSNLLRRLVKEHYNVIILKRSFSMISRISDIIKTQSIKSYNIDEIELSNVFQEWNVGIILHCATNYGRMVNNPLEIIEANLMLPLRLLLLGMEHGVRFFINTDTLLDKRINNYSLSKKHFLDWLKAYASEIKCINVALEHFYGFGDDKSKFVTKIIHDLVEGVDEIDLTEGRQKRDFIYIDDVVDAFLCIIANTESMRLGFQGAYVILDLALFSALQEYYLRTIGIDVCTDPSKELKGPVTICNTDIKEVDKYFKTSILPEFVNSLFIATWSLSESPLELRYILSPLLKKFRYFLIAYQSSFSGIDNDQFFREFRRLNSDISWQNWKINHLPGSHYLLGKRCE